MGGYFKYFCPEKDLFLYFWPGINTGPESNIPGEVKMILQDILFQLIFITFILFFFIGNFIFLFVVIRKNVTIQLF